MGSDGKKLKIESKMDLAQVISHLEGIVDSLKCGCLEVQTGEGALSLQPANIVEFELEISQKKDKEKIELELSWRREPSIAPGPELKLGGKE